KVAGSDTTLPIAWPEGETAAALAAAFHAAHERLFGFGTADAAIVIEPIEVEAAATEQRAAPVEWRGGSLGPRPVARRAVWFDDTWRDTPIYARDDLAAGATVGGPAVIVEANATTVVETGWAARVDRLGNLLLERRAAPAARERVDPQRVDPIMLEVMNGLFMHVAEQMGTVLERTAHSVNIKERLDFSCAVFDATGRLVANAPHIPVHLGSMGDTVRAVLAAHAGAIEPGDVFMSNAPYAGGTHLPDVTVVTPVCDAGRLAFVVASRAHHADIGGITPGSMPPLSRTIDEEGIVIDAVRIVRAGRFLEDDVRALLARGPYPARNPDQNVADLKAQVAANAR